MSTPSPSSRASSLLNAYEALRQAKAMLRGEQNPFPAAQDAEGSPPGPSPSPPQVRYVKSPSSSLDGALNSYGIHVTTTVGGDGQATCNATDGTAPHDHRNGFRTPPPAPAAATYREKDQLFHSAFQRTAAPSPTPQTHERSPSPDAQPPAPLTPVYRATESDSEQRRDQHVQFHVPPTPTVVTPRGGPAAPSFSPSPVPPAARVADPSVRLLSEVDVRTVQLLQCLSYDEVQLIRESLAQQERSMLRAELWTPPAPASTEETSKKLLTDNWTASPAALSWDTAPPVLLDVDAQLEYSELFYKQLLHDEGAWDADAVGATNQASEENSKEAAAPSTSAATTPTTDVTDKETRVLGGTVDRENTSRLSFSGADDELTLSPIAKAVSLSNSPAQRHHHPLYDHCGTNRLASGGDRHGHHASDELPPAAGPSILVSPQTSQRSPSATRPRLILTEPEQHHRRSPRTSSSSQPPRSHRTPRRGASLASSPAVSPADDALAGSISPSHSAATWTLADFDVGRRLGCGETGRTYLAREKRSKVVVALKCASKTALAHIYGDEEEAVSRGVRRAARLHMSAGRHCPHVAKLYTFFEDAQRVFFTLEYAEDGDLACYAARQPQGRLPEAQVQSVVHQLALALDYLHAHQTVHGAVTPRHVLLKNECTTAKLANFIRATRFDRASYEDEFTALWEESVDYDAPEVVQNRGHSYKSDMWALGVLTYELLCGYLPFEHVCTAQVKHLICKGVVYYPKWVSAKAKSFVGSLLRVEEAGRCDAAEALQHPFLSSWQRNSANVTAAQTCANHQNTAAASSPPASESLPIRRSLSVSFSQAEEARGNGATTADSTATPTGAASATSFLQLAGWTSNVESLTVSSPASSRQEGSGSRSAAGDNEEDQSESTSTVSNAAPTATTTTAPHSPFTFLNFALPSHSWRSSTQPYGSAGGNRSQPGNGGLPSLLLTSPPSVTSAPSDEADLRLRRRSSATSVKSTALSSRPSLTATLSDVSASLLSTTCAPTVANGSLVGLDGPGSTSSHHQRDHWTGVVSTLPFFSVEGEARVPCSVTVSSLTAASPTPQSEWASALDVEVSASSSSASRAASPLAPLTRHASNSFLATAVAGYRHAPATASQGVAQWPRALPSLTAAPTATTAAVAAAGAGKAKAKKATAKKTASSGPECAVRLDFDTLSDDDW